MPAECIRGAAALIVACACTILVLAPPTPAPAGARARMRIVERILFVALVAAAMSAGLTIAFVVGLAVIVWLSA
jgi:hypothetical protein